MSASVWLGVLKVKKDFCVRCGSENLKDVNREIKLPRPNPGTMTVIQECNECQECGEIYFKKRQIEELSRKINAEKRKL